jgi:hypothetical protein
LVLYFVQARKCNLIKIGVTEAWDARLSAIRRGNADDIVVIKTFHGSTEFITQLERDLHDELSGFNHHNEWFLDCPQVRNAIDRLDRKLNGAPLVWTQSLPGVGEPQRLD